MLEPYVFLIFSSARGEKTRKAITFVELGVGYYTENWETPTTLSRVATFWPLPKPPTLTPSSFVMATTSVPLPRIKCESPKVLLHSWKSMPRTRESMANPIQTKVSTGRIATCSPKSTFPPCSASASAPSYSSSGSSPPQQASASPSSPLSLAALSSPT